MVKLVNLYGIVLWLILTILQKKMGKQNNYLDKRMNYLTNSAIDRYVSLADAIVMFSFPVP